MPSLLMFKSRLLKSLILVFPLLLGSPVFSEDTDPVLPGPNFSEENILGDSVGVRPYRDGHIRIELEKTGGKTIIHNYGHGGAGLTLSWGSSYEAIDLLLNHGGLPITQEKIAVLGSGVVGLTTAYALAKIGYNVCIYTEARHPNTTSNVAGGLFAPVSVAQGETPDEQARFRRMIIQSFESFLKYGGDAISRLPVYSPLDHGLEEIREGVKPLIEEGLLPPEVLLEKLPFASQNIPGAKNETLLIDTARYLPWLEGEVRKLGVEFRDVSFGTLNEVLALPENIIFNCMGMGAGRVFNDTKVRSVRGQLVYLKQTNPPLRYMIYGDGIYLFPWQDRIVVGGTFDENETNTTPQHAVRTRLLEGLKRFFTPQTQEVEGAESPYTLAQLKEYLDFWVPDLDNTVEMKLYYLLVLHERRLFGNQTEYTYEQFKTDINAVKGYSRARNIPLAELIQLPELSSFSVTDESALDETAQELQLAKKSFEDVTNLQFLKEISDLKDPLRYREFVQNIYVRFRAMSTEGYAGFTSRKKQELRTKLLETLLADPEKAKDTVSMVKEMQHSLSKENVMKSALFALVERRRDERGIFEGDYEKWILRASLAEFIASSEGQAALSSNDIVAETNALGRFYLSLNTRARVMQWSETLVERILQKIEHFPHQFGESAEAVAHQDELRRVRQSAQVELHALPRLLAYYVAPQEWARFAFHPSFTFYRAVQDGKAIGVMCLVTLEDASESRYLAVTYMSDFKEGVSRDILAYLQVFAEVRGFKGVVVTRNRKSWPHRISTRLNAFTDVEVTAKLPKMRVVSVSDVASLWNAGLFRGYSLLRITDAFISEKYAALRPIVSQDAASAQSGIERFYETERPELTLLSEERMNLVLEFLDVMGDLLVHDNPDIRSQGILTLYKILFEEEVKDWLELHPEQQRAYIRGFVEFFENEKSEFLRLDALNTLTRIMRTELGLDPQTGARVRQVKPDGTVETFEEAETRPIPFERGLMLQAFEAALQGDTSHLVRAKLLDILVKLDIDYALPAIRERVQNEKEPTLVKEVIKLVAENGDLSDTGLLRNISKKRGLEYKALIELSIQRIEARSEQIEARERMRRGGQRGLKETGVARDRRAEEDRRVEESGKEPKRGEKGGKIRTVVRELPGRGRPARGGH